MMKTNKESYLNLLELALRGLEVYYTDLEILKIVNEYLLGGESYEKV